MAIRADSREISTLEDASLRKGGQGDYAPTSDREEPPLTIRNDLPERQDCDIEHEHAPALARRRELLDVERRDARGDADAPADEEAGTDEVPDGAGDGLADGAADEEDVGEAEDGAAADEVGEHAGADAAEERAEGRGGRDEFL